MLRTEVPVGLIHRGTTDGGLRHVSLGEAYLEVQAFEKAQDSLQRGLALFREDGDDFGQGNAYAALGQLHALLGHFEESLEHYEEALPRFRGVGEEYGETFVLDGLAGVKHRLGLLDDAADSYRRCVELRRRIGYRQGEAIGLHRLGSVLRDSDDLAGARECWEAALVRLDELGRGEADEVRAKLDALAANERT